MAANLLARRQIYGDTQAFHDVIVHRLPELLQRATGTAVTPHSGDGSFTIVLAGGFGDLAMHKQVRVHLGQVEEHEGQVSIPLRWHAEPARAAFPTFGGAIELRHVGHGQTEIVLSGRHHPPMGVLGELSDSTLLHGLAMHSVRRLVGALGDAVVAAVYGDAPPAQRTVDPATLTVADMMMRDPVVVEESTPLRTAAGIMLLAGISGVPVTGAGGRVVGVLSKSDVLAWIATEPEEDPAEEGTWPRLAALSAGDACTRPARMTSTGTTIRAAASEMALHGVDRLVVMDGSDVVGLLTRTDVIAAVLDHGEAVSLDVAAAFGEGWATGDVPDDRG